jgi:hypothetical protein
VYGCYGTITVDLGKLAEAGPSSSVVTNPQEPRTSGPSIKAQTVHLPAVKHLSIFSPACPRTCDTRQILL